MTLAGDNEVALKLPSVAAAILLLALMIPVGIDLVGREAALLGTGIAAVSAYLVWYAQEVRMYSLVAMLSLAALAALQKGLRGKGIHWWIAYILLTLASMYTHIYAALLLPAHVILCILWVPQRMAWRRALLGWLIITIGYLPWLIRSWRISEGAYAGRPDVSLLDMLRLILMAFATRMTHPTPVLGILFVLFLVLMAASLVAQPRRGVAALVLLVIVPLILIKALSWRQEIFGLPYVIVLAPAVYLLGGAGLAKLQGRWPVLGIGASAALLALSAVATLQNWTPEQRKEDWRAAARYVQSQATERDAVLVFVDYATVPFTYYYHGAAPIFAPFGGVITETQALEPTLRGLTQFEVVWLVQSHTEVVDPGEKLRRWFQERYPLVTEQYPRGVEIRGFATGYRLTSIPGRGIPVNARFGPALHLRRVAATPTRLSPRDDTYHPPSAWIHVTLYWEVEDIPPVNYRTLLRLTDSLGQVWGERLVREDEGRRVPAQKWRVGDLLRDDYDVNLNPKTPPGSYRLEIGLQRTDDGGWEEVHGTGGEGILLLPDRLVVQGIEVIP